LSALYEVKILTISPSHDTRACAKILYAAYEKARVAGLISDLRPAAD